MNDSDVLKSEAAGLVEIAPKDVSNLLWLKAM